MKVKNLLGIPVRLDDGKDLKKGEGRSQGQLVGAFATVEYGREELTDRDRKRVENKKLEIVAEIVEETKKPEVPDTGKKKSGGNE